MQRYRTIALIVGLLGVILFNFCASPRAWAATDLAVQFEKITGAKQLDRGLFARQTAEGNYIVIGETLTCYQHGHGKLDVYLAEINAAGRVLWQSAIGGSGDDRGLYVNQTSDGGFIVTGATVAEISRKDNDVYLVKTDPSGTIKWRKHFGGTGEDYGVGVEQTRDGGYILVGATNSQGAGDYDIYLIKLNAQGNKEWQKTFGGKEADLGVLVRQTSDGGYLLAGQTFSYASGGNDIYLAKTDPAGKRVWEKHYGRAGWDTVESLAATNDGGYIMAGKPCQTPGTLMSTSSKSTVWAINSGEKHSAARIGIAANPCGKPKTGVTWWPVGATLSAMALLIFIY